MQNMLVDKVWCIYHTGNGEQFKIANKALLIFLVSPKSHFLFG